LRIHSRCTPFATGCPIQTPASAVPFEEPGVPPLTPSTAMSVIVLMTGTGAPGRATCLLLAVSATAVMSVKSRRCAARASGLAAVSPLGTSQFPSKDESSTWVDSPEEPQTFSSLFWNVCEGDETLNAMPCTVAPPKLELPPTTRPAVRVACSGSCAYRL